MSLTRLDAIVLRRTNYGEADRILKLLTPEGQLSVMAKGARREKSKLAGGIELFSVSDVTVRSGRGDLGILTSARISDYYANILKDYDRLQFGYEVINAVTKASDNADEPQWFHVLQAVYDGLNLAEVPLQLTQTWFWVQYARLNGYELNLLRDVSGQKLDPGYQYMYDGSENGLRIAEQGEISANHIKYLRLIAHKPLRTVAQVGGIDDILPDCWLLARQHAAL